MSVAIDRLDAVPWDALSAQQRRMATVIVRHAINAIQAGDTHRLLELIAELPIDADALQNGAGRGEPSAAAIARPAAMPPHVVDLRTSLVNLLASRS